MGRRDSMIKTSGFRVSPTEVEDVAVRFPGVDSCVAVGLPNIEIGEDIALVYISSGPVAEADFRRFLKAELPGHMVPRFLVPQPLLPITGNEGKIDRRAVREALRAQPPGGDARRR
ncbi:MAG TPA: hypothetical protein VK586_00305, partial [Streptosporangiaceae bacterium]|nr:hypothetical protein [Streptosporangiaceae bacterium]